MAAIPPPPQQQQQPQHQQQQQQQHQRQNPLPAPPPLAMNTPPPMAVSSLISDDNSLPYPTHSSSSTNRPDLSSLPSTSFPEPAPISAMEGGRTYSLDICQQPIRARMCGFGDKDRRPITPPPCIRLVVKDAVTNKELEINDIDTSYFVLTVDLWNAEATKEVNLVKHSATSPSISATTATSYPPNAESNDAMIPPPPQYLPTPLQQMQMAQAYSQPPQLPPTSMPMYSQMPTQYPPQQYHHQPQYSQPYGLPHMMTQQPQQSAYWMGNSPLTPTGQFMQGHGQGPLLSPSALSTQSCDPRSNPSGMFTRNLIGSLGVSAFKLTDPDNVMGVWFILQDLSVRTEGAFRLKINFVNVGAPSTNHTLNTTSAPVLASAFSEVFNVFSAKKFPGVIESTNLSKCFATQGIKIPIRKDGLRGNERRPGDGDDDV